LSREAVKLGLDQNDSIIRRRLQQKMEFIADDVAAITAPNEQELADYLAKHPDAFRQEATITLRQVYLSPDKRGAALPADATGLLAQLKRQGAQTDVSALGDSTLLPAALADESRRGVEGSFGKEFAEAAFKLPVGAWSGPIDSGYGAHLVLVESRREGRLPPLAEVREIVTREWTNARRLEANRKLLDNLLKNYQVTIQWPKTERQP
jgi:hypothetical protein